MNADSDDFAIRGDWHVPASRPSNIRPSMLGDAAVELQPAEAATFAVLASAVCMPLVKHGRLIPSIAIQHDTPRRFINYDLSKIREVIK